LGHRLRLEHLWRLGLLALVDLAVLAQLGAVVPELEETKEDCDDLRLLAESQCGEDERQAYNSTGQDL
jgi:hypothetical protein